MTDADRDRLLQKLEETFVGIPRPECTKRVARALDDEWVPSAERVAELQRLDHEEQWQDLKPEEIVAFSDVLYWMSPDGFRFYFPAFLRCSIENWHRMHDRVQLETMEVIGRQPSVADGLTAKEALISAEILTELSVDSRGDHYWAGPSIQILENRAKVAACNEQR